MAKKGVKKEKSKEEKEIEEIKDYNKTLRNILIGIGLFFLAMALVYFIYYEINNFEYRGVEFTVEKFCDTKPCLTTYRTSVPVFFQGNLMPYNFYLRNDPRDLDSILFEGEGRIRFSEDAVFNFTKDFDCDGDDMIGIANLVKLYEIMGTKVIKDENAGCDPEGQYIFVNFEEGNETKIEQFGTRCYKIIVKDCEILQATEKFMVETFIKMKDYS